MNEPAMDTSTQRLDRLERGIRLLRWLSSFGLAMGVALIVLVFLTRSTPTLSFEEAARYAVVSPQTGWLYRLDTVTGEVGVFLFAPEQALDKASRRAFSPLELGRVPPMNTDARPGTARRHPSA